MFFCHKWAKSSSPPLPVDGKKISNNCPLVEINPESDISPNNEWCLPSILTAGSLDELANPPSSVPIMSAELEAQLVAATTDECERLQDFENISIEKNATVDRKRSTNKRLLLNGSSSMHSLVSSRHTINQYRSDNIDALISDQITSIDRNKDYFKMSNDGSFSLPLSSSSNRKKNSYFGLSLLSLTQQRANSASRSTLKKLKSLDMQSFPYENRYNDPWVGSIALRRTAKPNLENERHRENSLFLSILEAKGLQNKRRYYCDVCLDRTLYARTTSKQATENSIFWAEEFDLKTNFWITDDWLNRCC